MAGAAPWALSMHPRFRSQHGGDRESSAGLHAGLRHCGGYLQVGDLAASAIKSNHNIKDYGHLIPGHGGILDRFDSMIFTAPAIYFAPHILK